MRIEFYLIFHYIGFAREKAIGPSSDICVPFFLACTFSWQHSRNFFFFEELKNPSPYSLLSYTRDVFRDEKKPKILETSSGAKFERLRLQYLCC